MVPEDSSETRDVSMDCRVAEVGEKEAEEILGRAEVHGDMLDQKVFAQAIRQEGLSPKHKIVVDNATTYFFSPSYQLGHSRVAFVAYVEKEGKIAVRSYYRSNSQGVWRYLPDYVGDGMGGVFWYGKGHGEESITLPMVVQKVLSEIAGAETSAKGTERKADIIFTGTTRAIGHGIADYYEEINQIPRKLSGDFYPKDEKTPPEEMRFTKEEAPDFSCLLAEWEQQTKIYGMVKVEVFPSQDKKLKFMFCRDGLGRVWIGGIEDNSEIQSTGLRKSWVNGGDIVTPAYEYSIQAGGFGNPSLENDVYVDMYEGYLKKIPVIQEYIALNSRKELG